MKIDKNDIDKIKGCFYHNLVERIVVIRITHDEITKHPNQKEKRNKTITAAKQIFQNFLYTVKTNPEVIIPKPYKRDSLAALLEVSKFDWTNAEKFKEFNRFIRENYNFKKEDTQKYKVQYERK